MYTCSCKLTNYNTNRISGMKSPCWISVSGLQFGTNVPHTITKHQIPKTIAIILLLNQPLYPFKSKRCKKVIEQILFFRLSVECYPHFRSVIERVAWYCARSEIVSFSKHPRILNELPWSVNQSGLLWRLLRAIRRAPKSFASLTVEQRWQNKRWLEIDA